MGDAKSNSPIRSAGQRETHVATDETTTDEFHQLPFRERWKNLEYRRKCMKTLWLGACMGASGFAVGQRGPAFLDLQIITQTDVESASYFFTASSLGFLVGSLVAGLLYDKLNKSLVLLLSVLGLAVATTVLPWCAAYVMMIVINFIASLFAAGMETVANAELVRLWGKDSEMPMQFIQFVFAFGGVVAPLVTEPFLTPIPEVSTTAAPDPTGSSSGPFAVTSDISVEALVTATDNASTLAPDNASTVATALPLTTDVHYAYLISGVVIFLVTIPLTVEFFREQRQKRRRRRQDDKEEKEAETKQPLPMKLLLFVTSVLCLFYFIYCCVDDTFASFLATFVVTQLHWSKSQGAQVSSLFWGSFAVGRFLSIFASRCLNSLQLIVVCCSALVLSMLGFYLCADHAIEAGVWACTVAAALSMGPVFGAGFTWMEEELVRVTGRMVSVLMVASSAGNMVNPVVTGYLMQERTPMWFCYLLFAESVACLGVFVWLLAIARLCVGDRYTAATRKAEVTLEFNVPSLTDKGMAVDDSQPM